MTMTKLIPHLAISTLLFFNPLAHADLEQDIQDFCGKIKMCMLEQLGQQALPPEMEAQMNAVFTQQCNNAVEKYQGDITNAGLKDDAEACLSSLKDQTCAEIMSNKGAPHAANSSMY